jgi:hypothetical protein
MAPVTAQVMIILLAICSFSNQKSNSVTAKTQRTQRKAEEIAGNKTCNVQNPLLSRVSAIQVSNDMNRFFLLSGFPLRSLRLCGERITR